MLRDNDYIIKRSFSRYLIPSILSILGGNISIMIDNMIAGNVLGDKALAAMSIVTPVFFVMTTLGMLINGGASTIASISIGNNDTARVNQCFTWAVFLTVCAGALISVAGMVFLDSLIDILCGDPSLEGMLKDYCLALIPGALCIMAVYVPLNFYRIEGRAKLGMAMFIIMSVLDIVLDLVFAVVFDMGMFGLGLATVLSALIAVLVCSPFLIIRGGQYRVTSLKQSALALKIAITGSPLALNNFYSVIRVLIVNTCLLNSGGSTAVAALGFANSVNTIAQAFISGVSQATAPLAGVLHGEKDNRSIKMVISYASKTGLLFIGAYILLMAVFAFPLSGYFGFSGGAQPTAVTAITICAISLVPALINNIFVYYFMAVGRTAIANKIAFLRGLLFTVGLVVPLSIIFGANGVWYGLVFGELLTIPAIFLLSRLYRIKRKKTLAKANVSIESSKDLESHENPEGVLLLDMNASNLSKVLTFSVINNPEAVAESSAQVTEFCEQYEMTPKQTMMISLSIEEILLIMINHAYKDVKEHYIDVRIALYEDMIIIRFRCAGKPFNPLAYYREELSKKDNLDFGESLGINMLVKMVKGIEYTTTLGLNNMIIVI